MGFIESAKGIWIIECRDIQFPASHVYCYTGCKVMFCFSVFKKIKTESDKLINLIDTLELTALLNCF
jgi:hypothetical protein